MRAVPVRPLLLGAAFAIILGGSFSFVTSPWAMADLTWEIVRPIVIGAAIGFGFGLLAAWRPRPGWVIWLLTLPAVAGVIWFNVDRCLATTPGDDCSITWMIFLGWLVPWSIGIVVLAMSSAVTSWQGRMPHGHGSAPGVGST